MFDFEQVEQFGRSPPAQYLFTCGSPPKQKHKKSGSVKVRNRDRRRQAAAELAELDGEEAAALEAQLGVAPRELPPHLRGYALRRRSAACFSGPGLLPVEQEVGHVEYKLRLLDPTPSRFQQLVTQLNWRLSEGSGECLYALGVEDNGHPRGLDAADLAASLEVLQAMAAEVGAEAEVLQTPPGAREGRRCAVVRLVRAAAPAPRFDDVRVAVAGGVDSGKSTLVGVLCHGAGGAPLLDNGRGAARLRVFRHKHECESGHTSSVSLQQCCYDVQGRVLNYLGLSSLTPAEAAASASRMLRFFDLGGHERFSKTLLHGLTAMLPDHVLLCVSAVAGVPWATREHLAAALALGIPLLVAITKADLAGEAAVAAVVEDVRSLLSSAVRQGGGTAETPSAIAPLVQTEEQARQLAAGARQSAVESLGAPLRVPLFPVSAVTGASLQLLHAYFTALPPGCGSRPHSRHASMQGWLQPAAAPSSDGASPQAPSHFQVDGSFEVADVGTVYSGTVVSGSLRMGQQLLLGPLEGGEFCRVAITGIHRSKVDVREAAQGQHATLAVQPLDGRGDEGGDAGAAAGGRPGPPLPPRGDSVGCLHAWMAQSVGEAGTPPLAISGPARLPRSSLTAQLAGSVGGTLPRSAAGSSPQLTTLGSGSVAPKPRKGAVLLDPSLDPTPCSRFEAVLVLLGGCWPPRGLLTGCFPPEGDGEDDATGPPVEADAAGSSPGGGWQGGGSSARLSRGPSRRRLAAYVPVVHCGSIRQAAQVVGMRELSLPAGPAGTNGTNGTTPAGCGNRGDQAGHGEGQEAERVAGPGPDEELLAGLDPLGEPSAGSLYGTPGGSPTCRAHDAVHPGQLAGAVAAAGVLLPEALPARGAAGGAGASGACSSGAASGADTPLAAGGMGGLPLAAALELQRSAAATQDVGCVAAVTFSFMHQPEWLVEGARLIMRDHASGRIAGAGYVAAVHP